MISKKKLKERVLDIFEGAGITWLQDEGYFDYQNNTLACFSNAIQAIERTFDIDVNNSLLRLHWNWNRFETLEGAVGINYSAIEWDLTKKQQAEK